LLQFDTAIKEYNTALLEKKYVAAAQKLEKVVMTSSPYGNIVCVYFSKFHKTLFISRGAVTPWFVFDLYHQARSSLKMLQSRKGFELKILKALGTELTVQTQNILYHLGDEWQKLAVWKLPPSKGTPSYGLFHYFCFAV